MTTNHETAKWDKLKSRLEDYLRIASAAQKMDIVRTIKFIKEDIKEIESWHK